MTSQPTRSASSAASLSDAMARALDEPVRIGMGVYASRDAVLAALRADPAVVAAIAEALDDAVANEPHYDRRAARLADTLLGRADQ